MSQQSNNMQRRVPRYHEPSPHDVLAKLKATIDDGHRQMAQIEEKALSGHYADRLAAKGISPGPTQAVDGPGDSYGYQREVNEARQWRGHDIQKTTLDGGYGSAVGSPKTPQFTPPHIRVIQAEQRVLEARGRLEALVERMVGPQPENAEGMACEPNPWGGAAGEVSNSAARITEQCDRIQRLLTLLETVVP